MNIQSHGKTNPNSSFPYGHMMLVPITDPNQIPSGAFSPPPPPGQDYPSLMLNLSQVYPHIIISPGNLPQSRHSLMSPPDVIANANCPPQPDVLSGGLARPGEFPRGASLPPMICDELSHAQTTNRLSKSPQIPSPNAMPNVPIPPPRSRRSSTWSLNKSNHSLHLSGLADRLANFKLAIDELKSDQVNDFKPRPTRPPRRRDRFKNRGKALSSSVATLPRNFRASGQVPETSQGRNFDLSYSQSNTLIPLPVVNLYDDPSEDNEGFGNHNENDSSKAVTASDLLSALQGPKIPMPGGRKSPSSAEILITPNKSLVLSNSSEEAVKRSASQMSNRTSISSDSVYKSHYYPQTSSFQIEEEPIYEDIDTNPGESLVQKAVLNIKVNPNQQQAGGITMECQNQVIAARKNSLSECQNVVRKRRNSLGIIPMISKHTLTSPIASSSSTEYEEVDDGGTQRTAWVNLVVDEFEHNKDIIQEATANKGKVQHNPSICNDWEKQTLPEGHDHDDSDKETDAYNMDHEYIPAWTNVVVDEFDISGSSKREKRRSDKRRKSLGSLSDMMHSEQYSLDKLNTMIENLKMGMIKVYEDVYRTKMKKEHRPLEIQESPDPDLSPVQPERVSISSPEEECISSFRRNFLGLSNWGLSLSNECLMCEDIDWSSIAGQSETMQKELSKIKDKILSSIMENTYPCQDDVPLVRAFINCPMTLEARYSMLNLFEILNRNKEKNTELELVAEGIGQLAKIGQELLIEDSRRCDGWGSIAVAKDISIQRGITKRAPWELIQGGREILESLGYTEYTGYALQYPRNSKPEMFPEHIGSLTVELVLAVIEIVTLIINRAPNLETLNLLQNDSIAFPIPDEDKVSEYYPLMNEEPEEGAGESGEVLVSPKIPFPYENYEVRQPVGDQSREATGNYPESDYEEIASPVVKPRNATHFHAPSTGSSYKNASPVQSKQICDLCGSEVALVKCQPCSLMVFCLSCDEMYHKHPKRLDHSRMAISCQEGEVKKPPLPPKGDTPNVPIAPPRKLSRKGSTPDMIRSGSVCSGKSDMSSMSKRSFGPNKMSGRPLPPTPNPTITSEEQPRKSKRSMSLAVAYDLSPIKPSGRKLSLTSQPLNAKSTLDRHPSTENMHLVPDVHVFKFENKSVDDDDSNVLKEDDDWTAKPYHEEVHFPRKTAEFSGRRKSRKLLNRSSSMHDIAHGLLAQNNENSNFSWEDQHSVMGTSHQTPSISGFSSGFHGSNKSLHQDMWKVQSDWFSGAGSSNPGFNNPMLASGSRNSGSFHQSMHELHLPSSWNQEGSSPSQKSSHSRNGFRGKRKTKKNAGSRPTSRTASRNSAKWGYASDSDDSEEYFTGDSDLADFVSLSSGSNSKRMISRKSWKCDFCTFINNSGVNVCVMCCKTMTLNSNQSSKSLSQEEHSPRPVLETGARSKIFQKSHSSNEEDEATPDDARKKHHSFRRKGSKRRNQNKSPLMDPKANLSDLEQDAVNTYYAVRMGKYPNNSRFQSKVSGKRIQDRLEDSSSESSEKSDSETNFNPNSPSFFAPPAPAKGILKKSNSNPQLAKLGNDLDFPMNPNDHFVHQRHNLGISEFSVPVKGLRHQYSFEPNVVNIKKYLKRESSLVPNEEFWGTNGFQQSWEGNGGSNWSLMPPENNRDKISPGRSMITNFTNQSDDSGQDEFGLRKPNSASHENDKFPSIGNLKQLQRRTSVESSGKRNFRSKRFSRHSERLDVDNGFGQDDNKPDNGIWMRNGTPRQDNIHKNQTLNSKGPGGIGSYLARQEFRNNQQNQGPDSGYVSHSSGTGAYPKMSLSNQTPMEAFTMSVDRGYLGKSPGLPMEKDLNQYRSMEDISSAPTAKTKGLELVQLLREAEKNQFTPEDLQIALNHCVEDENPVTWLKSNWNNMMETVVTLASNAGHEAEVNRVGTLSKNEAREALRKHKGNVWAAVTECVEQRQASFDELTAKGHFDHQDVMTALTAHEGDVKLAFQELNKMQLKPFLVKIWGEPENEGNLLQGGQPPQDVLKPEENKETPYQPGDLLKNIALPNEDDIHAAEKVEPNDEVADEEQENEYGEIGRGHDNIEKEVERQARRYLAEGKVSTFEKGLLVVDLVTLYYDEDESLVAVEKCSTVAEAEAILRQQCELCTNQIKLKQVIKLPSCDHQCCSDCAKNYFSIVIRDKPIVEAVCPFCREPKALAEEPTKPPKEANDEDPEEDKAADYFAQLDVLLRNLVGTEVHELFERKLRDRILSKDPNFKWCYKCSSGFIADPRNKKLVCPDCRAMSCAKCQVPWEGAHDGISCEEFAKWKEDNDPDNQAKALEAHLNEHGIECPACKFRYTLSRGGCMHFTCSQCKFEFCIGCEQPFKMGVKCGKGPQCAKMGLHAHHPRNCLFYLRDKEPPDLQRILKKEKVEFKSKVENHTKDLKCSVQVQKETDQGMTDEDCGELCLDIHGGYCKVHYVEYLCSLVFRNKVDPVAILDIGELKQIFTRTNHFMPKQRAGEYEFQYKRRLAELVRHEIPLI